MIFPVFQRDEWGITDKVLRWLPLRLSLNSHDPHHFLNSNIPAQLSTPEMLVSGNPWIVSPYTCATSSQPSTYKVYRDLQPSLCKAPSSPVPCLADSSYSAALIFHGWVKKVGWQKRLGRSGPTGQRRAIVPEINGEEL